MTGAAEETLLMSLVTLKAERNRLGLSLDDVARMSGIAIASLSRLEGGRNPNPTFETLSRYAACSARGCGSWSSTSDAQRP